MGGAGALDLLHGIARGISAKSVIETGVAYGWSSLALLLAIHDQAGASLVSTDMPYVKMNNERWVGCTVPDELRRHWTLIRRADRQGIPKAIRLLPEIDLCHYDSDKTYQGRMWAYPKLWNHLRPGGVFISDDIGDNLAFKNFSETLGIQPIVALAPKNELTRYVGILLKPKKT